MNTIIYTSTKPRRLAYQRVLSRWHIKSVLEVPEDSLELFNNEWIDETTRVLAEEMFK